MESGCFLGSAHTVLRAFRPLQVEEMPGMRWWAAEGSHSCSCRPGAPPCAAVQRLHTLDRRDPTQTKAKEMGFPIGGRLRVGLDPPSLEPQLENFLGLW